MKMPHDRWTKAEIISKIISSIAVIAVPVVIIIIGNRFTKQQNNASRITDMIKHLSSDNTRERQIAIAVSEYFAQNDQLPNELLPVLLEIALSDSDKNVARGAVRSLRKVAAANKNLDPLYNNHLMICLAESTFRLQMKVSA